MSLRARRTLAEMIEGGHTGIARCPTCNTERAIDLAKLIGKVGPDYSLWNRRCRCRLTKGCPGWVHFLVGPGWPHKACDDEREWQWFFE